MDQILDGINIVRKAIKKYEDIKQRNTNKNTGWGCGVRTNYYRKEHEYEEGGRWGQCGNLKDHRRIYLCQGCYQAQQ